MSDNETRASYDLVAESYAAQFTHELDDRPLDRALLATVGELADGPIADLGCGPGAATAFLVNLGHEAFGVDLSPGMVAVARAAWPGIRFEVGSMENLNTDAASLGAIVAFYSIIHTPPSRLPLVFGEFARVLRAGGPVLLAFQVGADEHRRIESGFGQEVTLDAWRWNPETISGLLVAAGFELIATTVREPADTTEKGPRAYMIARKLA